MLQRSKPALDVDDSGASRSAEGGLNELVEFAVGFVLRQYPIILFVTALTVAAGIIYLRVTPPTYTAQATVLMGVQRSQFVQQQSIVPDAPFDSQQLESQLQVIKSRALASSIINRLKLLADPEFARPAAGSVPGLFESVFNIFSPDAARLKRNADPMERATAEFADHLTVTRVGVSFVIEIGFSSRSAERAAQIANAVANAYIVDQLDAKYEANRIAT